MMHTTPTSRRAFLRRTSATVAAVSIVPGSVLGLRGAPSPNSKLNLACIGIAGRGGANLQGVRGENVVALCDVDERHAAASFAKFPGAKKYQDFRKLLDEMDKQIDAVVVSTPDHTHAVAALRAMKMGKHLFCEKPLAHSIGEVRALMKAARQYKVITQLGNQGHSSDTIRSFCEWVWDGAIGNVHTVHAFAGSRYSRIAQLPQLEEKPPVPAGLNWDLWLGPAQPRPYNPAFLPGKWRAWTPFGSGVIGDWVCHVVDPVFWALDLGAPQTIQAEARDYDPQKHGLTFPAGARITYEFPARGRRGPVKLIWLDGEEKPPRPAELDADDKLPGIGAVVMGDKGAIVYGSHGAGQLRLIPAARMEAYQKPAQTIPRVKEHHADWIQAVKEGRPAGSHFDYGGPLTEIALLGIIAIKLLGQKLEWDAPNLRFPNHREATILLNPPMRLGWALEG
jgi:predicted dehydrogenase